MKNKIFSFIILALFMIGVNTKAPCEPILPQTIEIQNQTEDSLDSKIDEVIENSTKEVVTPHVEDIKVMTPNANIDVKNNVLNDSDSNLKFTIKKFLCAMAGVVVSSVIIFLILISMNKLNLIKGLAIQKREEDDNFPPSLSKEKQEIPNASGEQDALKIFFDKTN